LTRRGGAAQLPPNQRRKMLGRLNRDEQRSDVSVGWVPSMKIS